MYRSWSHLKRSINKVQQSKICLIQTLLDVKKAAHLQRELLRSAIDCCKVGGTIVYSTCSIAAEENEGVIDYILRKRFVKIVETGLPIDKEGLTSYDGVSYDPRCKFSRRVYPHMHNMDGFFIAKLIKTKDGPRIDPTDALRKAEHVEKKEVRKISKKGLGKRDRLAIKKGKNPANFNQLKKRAPQKEEQEAEVQQPEEKVEKVSKISTKQPKQAQTEVHQKKTAKPDTESADHLKQRKIELLKKLALKKKQALQSK